MKIWQKTFSTEDKLDVISWLEKGEGIVDMCHNVLFTNSSVHTFCGNADRIKESAKWRTNMFVCEARLLLPQFYQNEPYQKL